MECSSLSNDRLLSIADVAELLGICPVTASKVIHESGYGIRLHRKIYVLSSSLYTYLQQREGREC